MPFVLHVVRWMPINLVAWRVRCENGIHQTEQWCRRHLCRKVKTNDAMYSTMRVSMCSAADPSRCNLQQLHLWMAAGQPPPRVRPQHRSQKLVNTTGHRQRQSKSLSVVVSTDCSSASSSYHSLLHRRPSLAAKRSRSRAKKSLSRMPPSTYNYAATDVRSFHLSASMCKIGSPLILNAFLLPVLVLNRHLFALIDSHIARASRPSILLLWTDSAHTSRRRLCVWPPTKRACAVCVADCSWYSAAPHASC